MDVICIIKGICIMVNGDSIKETRAEKKIDKLFGKILSSDHIDELARKIAEKAIEKFNDIQNEGIGTSLTHDSPVLRVRKDPVDANTDQPENEDDKAITSTADHLTHTILSPKILESISSFLLQRPNLPLKNLGFKYRKQVKQDRVKVKDEEVNYDAMVDHDRVHSAERKHSQADKSSYLESHEKLQSRKSMERSHERKVVNLQTFRGHKVVSRESRGNSTNQDEDVYSGLEKGSRESLDTTTVKPHLTREENNKIFVFQSSPEYADYHHKLENKKPTKEGNY